MTATANVVCNNGCSGNAQIITSYLNWGDGTTDTIHAWVFSKTHTYTNPGTYVATLMSSWGPYGVGSFQKTVTVSTASTVNNCTFNDQTVQNGASI